MMFLFFVFNGFMMILENLCFFLNEFMMIYDDC